MYSMRELADCPESVNQQKSSDGAECNDQDGLSLRLRHLNLSTTTTDKTQKIERLPHNGIGAAGCLGFIPRSSSSPPDLPLLVNWADR
jgi:hypothetical protein